MLSNNLIEIASFLHPHEAQIAKANLEAAGIPVFISDEHTINMQWLYSSALGGVRLLVSKDYEAEAKELISKDFSKNIPAVVETRKTLCPHCGSNNVESYTIGKKPAFFVYLFLGLPLYFYKHCIKCNACGKNTKTYNTSSG